MLKRFFNGKILRDHTVKEEELWVLDGKIVEPNSKADESIDVEGLLVAPGFIDLQINGAFGHDFTSNPESADKIASQLPRYGVTSFLPTLVSCEQSSYPFLISQLQPKTVPNSAEILGIHLEGPFFNPKKVGAHSHEFIRSLNEIKSLEDFYGSLEGVKIVTLAPELPGAFKAIEELKRKNIVISAGHSEATYAEMQEAIKAGLSLVSHLFNQMIPLHHRSPGIIGAVLTDPDMHYTIIADGAHLHPAALMIAWKANPEGLTLVTDAIAPMGLTSQFFSIGKIKGEVDLGKAFISGTTQLAGSLVSMDVAVRWFRFCSGCSAIEALEAASLKPAQILGIQTMKGSLQIGCDADLILVDEHLHIHSTYIAGEKWQEGPIMQRVLS